MADIKSLDAFTADQLADLARAEASVLWHDHRKLEMIAGAIAAPLSAFLVGAAVYLFGSSPPGIPYGAIVAGVVAAVLGTTLTLGIIYGYYRFIEAPSNLYFKTNRQLSDVQQLLEQEKAKNADPKLAGHIDCLDIDITWDLERYAIDEICQNKLTLKAVFAIKVTLWNESNAATTISDFVLDVCWRDAKYSADRLPVESYFVRRTFP